MTASVRLAACVLSGCLAVGCGGESSSDGSGGSHAGGTSSGGSGGTSGAGGSGLGGAGGAGGTILQPGLDLTVLDETSQPITGAIVVVDRPDGSRDETKTDALGVASFPNVDFTLGLVDVTAFSPGQVLVTVLGVGATSSHVIHLRKPLTTDWTQKVTVNFKNMLSSSDCVRVSSTASTSQPDACADSASLSIPPGASGKILAMEHAPVAPEQVPPPPIKAAVVLDLPVGASSVDVDFSQSALIEHASGSIELPMKSGVEVGVTSRPGGIAALSSSSPGAGNSVDWDADFFRPFPSAEARTWFTLHASDPFVFLIEGTSHPGYPGEGVAPPMPKPAKLSGTDPSGLFGPIDWTASTDRPDNLSVQVVVPGSPQVDAWDVWFAPERDSVTLPKPPDSIWNALSWKDAKDAVIFLKYCDPGPDQCAGSPCAPTDDRRCVRSSLTFRTSYYELSPP